MTENERTITEMNVYEISLVYIPANPWCTFTVIGADGREVHASPKVV